MFRTALHFNPESTLAMMPALLQSKFGIQKKKDGRQYGSCFVSQIAFSIAAVTGLRALDISRHILSFLSNPNPDGWTLAEVMDTFKAPILTRSGPRWIRTQISVYQNIHGAINGILHGIPVIVVVPREVCDALELEARMYDDGQSYATVIRPSAHQQYHALLAFGFEVQSEVCQSDFFLLRDTRDVYCRNGYLKVGANILNDGFNAIRMFSVEVLSVTD